MTVAYKVGSKVTIESAVTKPLTPGKKYIVKWKNMPMTILSTRCLRVHGRCTLIRFEDAVTLARRLDDEVGQVIIGQTAVRREILTCLFARRDLPAGVPGLAKTLLIKTLADAVQLKFNRIQFLPT